MVTQALSMGKEPDANPHPLLMQTWNESMALSCRRQVTVDEVAHQLQISRHSAYGSIHNRHAFHKVCT
jgi:alpha-D-ribose 1-methylphosphonate 5-phosphate C-P lyase